MHHQRMGSFQDSVKAPRAWGYHCSDTPMLWEPLRYLESCPSSDGACAMVITAQDQVGSRNVAWIKGMAVRSEGTLSAGRDEVNPQAGIDCAKDISFAQSIPA